MRRYGLRDDQWDRTKDLLPGREGHVGGTAKDNRLFIEAVLYRLERDVPGATYLSGLAIGKRSTNGSAGWRKAGSSIVRERHAKKDCPVTFAPL
jgi:hypothetical protein